MANHGLRISRLYWLETNRKLTAFVTRCLLKLAEIKPNTESCKLTFTILKSKL